MITSLYLSLNPEKADAPRVADDIRTLSGKYGLTVVDSPDQADCIITIGGDGTFLYGTRLALEHSCALAGINLGRFGFLPSFTPDDIDTLLTTITTVEPHPRSILDVEASEGQFHAINEMVLERKRVQRAARITMISSPPVFGTLQQQITETDHTERAQILRTQFDDVIEAYSAYTSENGDKRAGPVFVCDGVIVATPLGSTAYSSSAGGPAVSPYSSAMSVTFSALHHPRIPPVVLTNNENIYLQAEEETIMVVDGRHVIEIAPGEVIRVSVGSLSIRVFEKPASVLSRLAHAFGSDRQA